jgi:hypothetical protein
MDRKIVDGLLAMNKDELLNFATTAIKTIERLEASNRQFREDLEASGTVDVEVIWRWRAWLETLNTERDNWAQLATTLSAENKALRAENQKIIDRCASVLRMLDGISVFTQVQVDVSKPPSFLVGAFHRVKKAIDSGKSAMLEFFADEPVEVAAEAADE